MLSNRDWVAAASLIVGLAALGCTTPSIRPQPHQLTGSWDLLNAVSELPTMVSQSAGELASGGANAEELRAALRFATQPPRKLSISQTATSVKLTIEAEKTLLLYTDGRHSRDPISGSPDHECHAIWKGGVLFVEHLLGGRTHVVETYSRSADGTQLLVSVMLQDSRLARPLTSLRAYGAS